MRPGASSLENQQEQHAALTCTAVRCPQYTVLYCKHVSVSLSVQHRRWAPVVVVSPREALKAASE